MICARVLPNLIFGPAPLTEDDFRQLKALNVTAILSLQTEDDYADGGMENERDAALGIGMSFTNLTVTDFDRLELLFRNCPSVCSCSSKAWAQGTLRTCIARRA